MNMLYVIFAIAALAFLSTIVGKKMTALILFAVILFGYILSVSF